MSATADENVEEWTSVSFPDFFARYSNEVPHITQSKIWDCGVACAEMAMRARRVKDISSEMLRKKVGTESVWSIDLAFLFLSCGINATLYTSIKGVRPEYNQQAFYRREIDKDTERVTALFAEAPAHNVRVILRETTLDDIRDAIFSRDELVLVLLDKRKLRCEYCSRSVANLNSECLNSSSNGFLGHYVLLFKYHLETDTFLMKDSSSVCITCVIRADVLESARTAFGTDHDTIFVGDSKLNTPLRWKRRFTQ